MQTTWDLLYMGRYAKRKPGLNEGQDCCPCTTLHIPLFFYVQLGVYKLILKIKLWVLHRCWAPPCRSFLPFSGWIPIWSAEARQVYLLALDSKIHVRGSPRRGTPRYASGRQWPNVDGANLLSRGFISFPCKPSYSASSSPPIFPTTLSVSNLSLYL